MIAPSGTQYTLRHGVDEAVVTEVGATLRSFRHRGVEVLDGFAVDAMASAGRGQVLAPWPNRVDAGRYEFSGRTAKAPLDDVANGCANHGTVRWRPFTLRARAQNQVTLGLSLLPTPAYPFAIDLSIAYHLGRSGLSVTATATSRDEAPVPFGLGFHPYLAVGPSVEDAELEVRAHTWLPTDDRLLPTGDRRPAAGGDLDYTSPRRIGAAVLNCTLTDLERDLEGLAWVHLGDRWRGVTASVWMDQAFPYVQLFTGDTVPEADRRRTALAVEPMTCPPNALVSGEDLVVLAPGERFVGRYGICATTEEDRP